MVSRWLGNVGLNFKGQAVGKRLTGVFLCLSLVLTMWGCSGRSPSGGSERQTQSIIPSREVLEEVSPPVALQELRSALEQYEPKVKLVGLKSEAILDQTTATVRFEVEDFPLFKDPDLGLGPHLHLFLDDLPYQAIYDTKQAVTFKGLAPGTHTLRVFASRPWHESFKSPEAYDAVTFHVFAPTQANQPDPTQPLLTYSRPQGEYGAEPIMLDYYLKTPNGTQGSNSPATVRVTINGESFTTATPPPLYLKGFHPGVNWVKLELLERNGKRSSNAFSETVRLVTLKPNGTDTLSKLVRGELTAQEAESIVSLTVSQQRAAEKRAAAEQRAAAAKQAEEEKRAAEEQRTTAQMQLKVQESKTQSPTVLPIAPVPSSSPSPKPSPAFVTPKFTKAIAPKPGTVKAPSEPMTVTKPVGLPAATPLPKSEQAAPSESPSSPTSSSSANRPSANPPAKPPGTDLKKTLKEMGAPLQSFLKRFQAPESTPGSPQPKPSAAVLPSNAVKATAPPSKAEQSGVVEPSVAEKAKAAIAPSSALPQSRAVPEKHAPAIPEG